MCIQNGSRMLSFSVAIILSSIAGLGVADVTPYFEPPSVDGPLFQTANYTGFSNNTLNDINVVPGVAFDRFIHIWFENTDFSVAHSTETFLNLSTQGLLFTNYQSVTHPSEPNYVASIGGDFFGMHEDDYFHIPSNISSILDILEDSDITWATYQENMPTDGFNGESFTSVNYQNSSAQPYPYYMRKHNPPMIFDSVNTNETRYHRVRNFNDLANDIANGTLSQWIFITPNIVNDAHDTNIDFAASFLDYFLPPLLASPAFNTPSTLILVTFDENESYDIQNNIFALALGNAVPPTLRGTTDSTFYTHYSTLSTVQANWDLQTLGRNDANRTLANVFSWVADAIGYTNVNISTAQEPLLNLTGVVSGPLNSDSFQPFTAPNMSALSPTGRSVFVSPLLNTTFTASQLPAPVDLTALGEANPFIYA